LAYARLANKIIIFKDKPSGIFLLGFFTQLKVAFDAALRQAPMLACPTCQSWQAGHGGALWRLTFIIFASIIETG